MKTLDVKIDLPQEVKHRCYIRSLNLRLSALKCVRASNYGFLGSCLSVSDILSVVYDVFNIQGTPDDQDILILSKGHASPSLYALMGDVDCLSYAHLDSPFQGHPNSVYNSAVSLTTGSLGNGLAVAVGMAWAARLKRQSKNIIVIVGDGELQAGLFWEAYLRAISTGGMKILILVDENSYQSDGAVSTNTTARKMFANSSPNYSYIDGHDYEQLYVACQNFKQQSEISVVVARTKRGSGVPALEEHPLPMSWIPSADELNKAIGFLQTNLLHD